MTSLLTTARGSEVVGGHAGERGVDDGVLGDVQEVRRDLDRGRGVLFGRVGLALRAMQLVLGLALVDAGADLVERALHRRLGLVPPRAAGFGGVTDGGLELADVGLERFVDLVAALLELRAIRLERGGCGVFEHLDASGELLQGLGQWFHGFSVSRCVLTRRT